MDSWCWWSFVQINHYLYITNQNFKNIIIFFFLILPLTFSQVKICWNEHNTLHSKMRIWHLGVLRRKKFISIALVVLKIFKRVKSATFSLTRCKPDVNKIKGKNGRLYAINVCRMTMAFLDFTGNPFYICLRTYYSINLFYYVFVNFLVYA